MGTTKIFVGNIRDGTTSESLRELFECYGRVTEADVLSGFGFVVSTVTSFRHHCSHAHKHFLFNQPSFPELLLATFSNREFFIVDNWRRFYLSCHPPNGVSALKEVKAPAATMQNHFLDLISFISWLLREGTLHHKRMLTDSNSQSDVVVIVFSKSRNLANY